MAHLQCIFYSKALEMDTCVNVILPNEGDMSKTRVVFLLHGLSDNYSAWCRYTQVERYALAANVAVVMPEVQRSFYCDTVSGIRMFLVYGNIFIKCNLVNSSLKSFSVFS